MEFNIASQLSEVAEITITPMQFTRYIQLQENDLKLKLKVSAPSIILLDFKSNDGLQSQSNLESVSVCTLTLLVSPQTPVTCRETGGCQY